MLKDGMKIEATHVKKKQLHQYLPAELVQKKKRVSEVLYCACILKVIVSIVSVYSPPFLNVSSFVQSIAELNRSSNGGSSKRISLDSSHLDSSRDTDSGTPFTSPTSKPSKPTSDTEDRYDIFWIFTMTRLKSPTRCSVHILFALYFAVSALPSSFLWKAPQHLVQHLLLQTRACPSLSSAQVSLHFSTDYDM